VENKREKQSYNPAEHSVEKIETGDYAHSRIREKSMRSKRSPKKTESDRIVKKNTEKANSTHNVKSDKDLRSALLKKKTDCRGGEYNFLQVTIFSITLRKRPTAKGRKEAGGRQNRPRAKFPGGSLGPTSRASASQPIRGLNINLVEKKTRAEIQARRRQGTTA